MGVAAAMDACVLMQHLATLTMLQSAFNYDAESKHALVSYTSSPAQLEQNDPTEIQTT